ncbi:MAG: hypothetical protein K6G60_07485 [Lachnospiraceae bacterium]|nr:hypothetical protein [Lachnospiraceae bacterium]
MFAGCSENRVPVTPTPTPVSGVKVVTLAPTRSVTPTPSPTPFSFPAGETAVLNDLSGNYRITFPAVFDKCIFDTKEGSFSSIYSSSEVSGVYLIVSYAVKGLIPGVSGTNVKTESVDIKLPSSYFWEDTSGDVDVTLSVTAVFGDYGPDAFEFGIKGLD